MICKCGKDTTGWTEVKCCNLCGLPVEKWEGGEIISSWRDGKTAPKNGKEFLADIGYGFAVVAAWNEYDEHYVYASFDAGEMELKLQVWSEQELCDVTIERWMPMPEIES